MNPLLQRWHALAPREQWMAFAVALLLPAMAWLMLGHDPLAQRLKQLQGEQQGAETRRLDARSALAELQARAAVDPDLALRQALLAAQAVRDGQLDALQRETAALIDPQRMQRVLQDLLQTRPGLRLLGLESFSAPLVLPAAPAADPQRPASGQPAAVATANTANPAAPAPAPILYRHGMRLTLEGSYFELRDYLQDIERQSLGQDGRRLFWERLDYQVDEAGPGKARITLELYTLSREAGWIGV
ncbi:type II secretion system protein M [Pseudomonas sp. MAP12]|uniref:Type II secretion system protein M n=1 Tax=Geopseudomonas aromaticivorans TaxID=2849492 RepID=A0ABS6MY02_9GAMM|nr:type II secretion system protein M [Pseudomonas aromaticivorans]MBV2133425.1 type II secretion system protein M [Pseudomonas aromaticivorans]